MKTVIYSIVKWVAGFFEDTKKSASSKRAIVYIATYLMFVIVLAARDNRWANDSIHSQIWWGIVSIVAFGVGAITSEAISKIFESKYNNKDE